MSSALAEVVAEGTARFEGVRVEATLTYDSKLHACQSFSAACTLGGRPRPFAARPLFALLPPPSCLLSSDGTTHKAHQ